MINNSNLVDPPNYTRAGGKCPSVSITVVKSYEYPDGVEIVGYVEKVYFGSRLLKKSEVHSERKTYDERCLEHARRASCAVRRRARNAGLTKLWTFTFPGEGVHEYTEAERLFARWLNDYGNKYLGGYYVAVPEMHPGGHGWHWHLLTRKYVNVNIVRRSWTMFLANRGIYPTGGAKLVRVHVKRLGSTRRAASYISKYITKELGRYIPKGRKRYKYGVNTSIPEPKCVDYYNCGIYDTYSFILEGIEEHSITDYYSWIYDPLNDRWPCFVVYY